MISYESSITEKQRLAISIIQMNLPVVFRGTTRFEAIEFIGRWMERSKVAAESRKRALDARLSFREKKQYHLSIDNESALIRYGIKEPEVIPLPDMRLV